MTIFPTNFGTILSFLDFGDLQTICGSNLEYLLYEKKCRDTLRMEYSSWTAFKRSVDNDCL